MLLLFTSYFYLISMKKNRFLAHSVYGVKVNVGEGKRKKYGSAYIKLKKSRINEEASFGNIFEKGFRV